ncbi:MAG TPA: porphobilinogen synthase [Acidimicrobiales bacterium]|nr:porphobilinogen synthase [Acidimicrobiales bacterium]
MSVPADLFASSGYPSRRMRRLRRTPALRRLVAETRLSADSLIAPLFVAEGIDEPREIPSMPGVVQHTLGSLVTEAWHLRSLGVGALLIFGVPSHRDSEGSGAYDPDGITQRALSELSSTVGDSMVICADLCLDEYTDHGHCGVLDSTGAVDNDATIELYGQVATAQAAAGAQIVAPSGMMDGQVAAIRRHLDAQAFGHVAIMSYSAKYASALYGPFRDAVDVSLPPGTDRKSYQQDPANQREALLEVELDIAEGADIVMVKPALSYLDVIAAVKARFDVPVAAYQVSGEYSMVCAAGARGWLDVDAVAMEQLESITRAGADMIVTYFAARIAEILNG